MSGEGLAVERALAEARAQKHHFVFIPNGASQAVVDALRELAAETGREFMPTVVKGATDEFVQRRLSRDVPTVPQGDNRAFLDNLKEISRGSIRVTR